MKKFVKIASEKTITVTPDLRSIDTTNHKSPIADRLSVKPAWTRFRVTIKRGTNWYPAEVATWDTVKAFAANQIFTIGETSDTCPNQAEVEVLCNKLSNATKKYEADIKKTAEILGKDRKSEE